MRAETSYHAVLGQVLKELRKDKGIDQSEIAQKMDINRSSWSQIENGNATVNMQQLKKIGAIFKMEASEIVLKADTIAKSLEDRGYKVHYDSPKEIQEKSSGAQGLAIIGAAALGLLVGSMLFGKDDKDDKNNNP